MENNNLQKFLDAVRNNETLIKGYASKKCKDCFGRGVVEMNIPGEGLNLYVCSCTIKNAKKDFLQNE